MAPDPSAIRPNPVHSTGPTSPRSRSSVRPLVAGVVAVALTVVIGCEVGGPPTYAGDVAEVLNRNCVTCHRPAGPGPMSLLDYETAAEHADDIARMTGAHRMPPWLPERGEHDFRGERGLTEGEIALLADWANAGAPRGDSTAEPPTPELPEGWILGEPDLVLELDEPFLLPGTTEHDLYRNFVLDIPLDAPRWVEAVELLPENPAVVHHATMQVDPTQSSRLNDLADPQPGYDDRISASAARPPGGFFLAWTPGLVPSPYPDEMAWRAEPGTDFVVQLHLWPTGEPEQVRFRVGLHFTDEEPTKVPTILRLGGQQIDIPPGEPDYRVEDSFEVPVDIEVYGVYPHAHFLGKRIDAWGITPAGDSIHFMTIPDWDFNWQDAYYYAEPIRIPAGTTLRKRWTFDNTADNSQNPHTPPQRVVWGLNSTDEMAEFWIQAVTDTPEDLEELQQAARVSDSRKQIEGWEFLVALDSTNADAQRGLAAVAHARGDYDEALRRYGIAIRSEPQLAPAHHGLAQLHEDMGNLELAIESYRNTIDVLPYNPAAMTDLGRLHAQLGELEQAQGYFEQAVEMDSTHVDALNNLGSVLRDRGRPDEALPWFQRAVQLRPDLAEARFNLSLTLASMGYADQALNALDQGLARDPENLQAVLSLAWLLATDPDDEVRDPEIAADLALQVHDVTGPDPVVSDVVAAAFAALGQPIEAVQFIVEAIEAAEAAGASAELIQELEARRRLFGAGQMYLRPEG